MGVKGEKEPIQPPVSGSSEPRPAGRRPYEVFGFNEDERTFWRVKQERFNHIIEDESTLIHEVKASSNQFGEFLFVTTSKPGDDGRVAMVFYGLGYHEHRERWIEEEWYWYQNPLPPELVKTNISKEDAREQLKQRLEELGPQFRDRKQTERGKLFELLADLTDEDGALAEIEDIEDLAETYLRLAGDENKDSAEEMTEKPNQPSKPDPEEENKSLFSLGQVVATPGALMALQKANQLPVLFLQRHQAGDWGDVPEEDRAENDLAVAKRFRLLSSYKLDTGSKIWIITEWNRSITTILLPNEY